MSCNLSIEFSLDRAAGDTEVLSGTNACVWRKEVGIDLETELWRESEDTGGARLTHDDG
jgi:hypothetical protein